MSDDTKVVDAIATQVRERLDATRTELTEAQERAIGDHKAEITERLEAFDAKLTDDALAAMVRANFEALIESDDAPEVIRKLRHGGADLAADTYMGLQAGDAQLMHDLLESAASIGRSSGPSEKLRNFVATSRGGQTLSQIERAHDTAESGFGSQLVGAQYVNQIWRGAETQFRVYNLLQRFRMTDATSYLPVAADIPALQFVAENTANNSNEYGTSKTGSNRVTVTAKKLLMHQMWSGEMEEDSIVAYIPFIRDQASRGWAHGLDSVVLNGDTTNAATGNINLDDADPADTEPYLAFDGIRHAAIVDNTANLVDAGGAIVVNDLRDARIKMADPTYKLDWGHPTNADDLVFVADPETVDHIAFLTEALTVDKYGPRATILTGEQARILNHPLISSQAVSKTEADGKVSTTGSNNTKGQVVAFNRGGFVVGERRMLQVEAERLPARDQNRLVWSTRIGLGRFSPTGAAAGIEQASVIYNITL